MKSRKMRNISTNFRGISMDNSEQFRHLSYYIQGGVDLAGQELRKDAHVEYDNEDDVTPKIIKNSDGTCDYGEINSCAMCDPRIGHFDIVEQLGAEKAQEAFGQVDKLPTPSDDGEKE